MNTNSQLPPSASVKIFGSSPNSICAHLFYPVRCHEVISAGRSKIPCSLLRFLSHTAANNFTLSQPVASQALLSLVKARQSLSTPPLTNLPDKPSPGDPDFILPEAERGISEETLKKITDAIRLY